MELTEYLNDSEKAIQASPASEGDSTRVGKLVCTPQRVVFTQGKEVIDIDTDRIDAIKFTGPTYPRTFAAGAGSFAVAGTIGALVSATAVPEIPMMAALSLFVVAAVVFFAGVFMMKETLEIHTGASEFTFKAKNSDLASFPSAVRQRSN